MEQETPKKKINSRVILFVGILLIVGVVMTMTLLRKTDSITSNAECCATICDQFNQECRGWEQDTLQCTFNYNQYGLPEVDEVFTFKIADSMKERLCNTPQAINDTFEPITNLTATE